MIKRLLLFLLFGVRLVSAEELKLSPLPLPTLAFEATRQGKSKVLLLCALGGDEALLRLGNIIRFDLEFTDQMEVDLKKATQASTKALQTELFNRGISLCCMLEEKQKEPSSNHSQVQIVVKDTRSDTIIFEKVTELLRDDLVTGGHQGAGTIMPILTGEEGVCLANIAYCKQISPKHKVICIADYACKKEAMVVSMKSINVIPCWHKKKPILFYTQLGRSCNRLMAVNLSNKRHSVVASFKGLNMQPSVSEDGTQVVLCLSQSGSSELYLYDEHFSSAKGRRVFKQLTFNGASNFSPVMLANGDIIFCSDKEQSTPHIYYLDMKKNSTHRLTANGYCTAPSFCERTRELFFTKPVNGTFQIFKLPLDKNNLPGSEKQLTFTDGDKKEPAISECGRYVLFSYRCPYEKGIMTTQIAALNCLSGKIRVLTTGKEEKSFPAWRPRMV